jgi:hypothetical protein
MIMMMHPPESCWISGKKMLLRNGKKKITQCGSIKIYTYHQILVCLRMRLVVCIICMHAAEDIIKILGIGYEYMNWICLRIDSGSTVGFTNVIFLVG